MMTTKQASKWALALSGAAALGALAPELALVAAGHAALLAIGVKIVRTAELQSDRG
ncbi:MAG TPA: hypothetical protein VGM90_22710 [Kofleriaceae bacterium]|jgi:hypothetical protein